MGVDHHKQERGLPVKYHPTNSYGQYDIPFHYGWLFTLTAHLISYSEFQTDLPIRTIQTPTYTLRRRCSTFKTGRTRALVMAVTITLLTLHLSKSNVTAPICVASTLAFRMYITLNNLIYYKIGHCLNPKRKLNLRARFSHICKLHWKPPNARLVKKNFFLCSKDLQTMLLRHICWRRC